MPISYTTWLANVKLIVQALADERFQRDAWSGIRPTSFGSPDEMMCVYFDDVLVPEFIAEYAGELGKECVAAGTLLTLRLQEFAWPMDGDFISVESLTGMPEWSEVCTLASAFLRRLPVGDALFDTKQ